MAQMAAAGSQAHRVTGRQLQSIQQLNADMHAESVLPATSGRLLQGGGDGTVQ